MNNNNLAQMGFYSIVTSQEYEEGHLTTPTTAVRECIRKICSSSDRTVVLQEESALVITPFSFVFNVR